LKARERKIREAQDVVKKDAELSEVVIQKNKVCKKVVKKERNIQQKAEEEYKERELIIERRERNEKLKEEVLHKKAMAQIGRDHHVKVKKFIEDFNPYAARINQEIHEKTSTLRSKASISR
jgi:Rps23 Pro-64 3,4-dihydroxylase Tpa1-like proline 4-hydroxylase